MGFINHKSDTSKKTATDKIKGALLDFAADLGLGKGSRVSMREQQTLSADVIAKNRQLRDRLGDITFTSPEFSKFPIEQLEKDESVITRLIVNLEERSSLAGPDTRKIDTMLHKICDELEEAYRRGDEHTAQKVMKTLVYGVMSGHKPLKEKEKETEAQIMAGREAKLLTYVMICQASTNAYAVQLSVQSNQKMLIKDIDSLEDYQKEVEEFKKKKPHAVEAVDNAGGYKNDLDPEALEYVNLLQKVNRTDDAIVILTTKINQSEIEITNYQSLIKQWEISLNKPNEYAKDELIKFAKEKKQEIMEDTDKQITSMIEIDNIVNSYYNSFIAITQDQRVKGYAAEKLEQYQQRQEKRREKEAAAERARKRREIENKKKQENEQNNEQDNEQENEL